MIYKFYSTQLLMKELIVENFEENCGELWRKLLTKNFASNEKRFCE